MTDAPAFDPFAALAAAKAQRASKPTGFTLAEPPKTFAALSQTAAELKDKQNQDVAENFAAFATFAGGAPRARENSCAQNIRKKEDFPFSLQGLTTDQGKPWLAQEARRETQYAGAPAKAAILRKNWLSHCVDEKNKDSSSAKALRKRGPADGADAGRVFSAAKVDQAAFDERAAFLEYDAGLPRADAERQAAEELQDRPQRGLPDRDGLALWRAALDRLSPHRAPCSGYRGDEWPRTLARARSFLDHFGEQAESLGWTAPHLLGVHPKAGIIRPDACGALVLPIGGPVVAISDSEIRFGHLRHRTKPGRLEGVPLWELGR